MPLPQPATRRAPPAGLYTHLRQVRLYEIRYLIEALQVGALVRRYVGDVSAPPGPTIERINFIARINFIGLLNPNPQDERMNIWFEHFHARRSSYRSICTRRTGGQLRIAARLKFREPYAKAVCEDRYSRVASCERLRAVSRGVSSLVST